jgi:hypothetical protein
MDQWKLHTHGFMNAHAKSTHKEVCVYPSAWKQTQYKSFKTLTNDTDTGNDNYIDLYIDKYEEKKPQALFITADMRFFQYPAFHAPVETSISSRDRPTNYAPSVSAMQCKGKFIVL